MINSGADIEQGNPYYKNATPVVIAVICKKPKVVDFLIGVSHMDQDVLLGGVRSWVVHVGELHSTWIMQSGHLETKYLGFPSGMVVDASILLPRN